MTAERGANSELNNNTKHLNYEYTRRKEKKITNCEFRRNFYHSQPQLSRWNSDNGWNKHVVDLSIRPRANTSVSVRVPTLDARIFDQSAFLTPTTITNLLPVQQG